MLCLYFRLKGVFKNSIANEISLEEAHNFLMLWGNWIKFVTVCIDLVVLVCIIVLIYEVLLE